MRKVLSVGLGALLMGTAGTYAAGFALYEGSARGNAMGSEMTGSADDPAAMFVNPAGITQLDGVQVMGGATVISPMTDVETTTPLGKVTTTTERNYWIPPHAYGTFKLNEKVWMGLATYSRFGLGTEFPETWPGRYNNYYARIQSVDINPNLALKLHDKVSVAAGFQAMWFDMKLQRKMPNPMVVGGPDLDFTMTGDSWGYGFNLATHVKPTEWMGLGLSYFSRVKQEIEGTANATVMSTDANGDITLPDMIFAGLSFKPAQKWMVNAGLVYTMWSTYDELKVDFDQPIGGSKTSVTKKDYKDVFRYQLGTEYKLSEAFDLRAGYVYDNDPVPDETVDYLLPAYNRHIIGGGIGWHIKQVTLDLSYNYLIIQDRTVTGRPAEGVFNSSFENGYAHMVGISVSGKI